MKVFRRLYPFIRPYSGKLAIAFLSMIVYAFFNVQIVTLLRPIIDEVWKPDVPLGKLFGVSIFWFIILVFLGKGVFWFVSQYLMNFVGQSVVMDLRSALYEKILYRSMRFFMDMPTGALLSRVTNDVERVHMAVSDKLCDLLRESIVVIGLAIVLISLDWRLSIGMLVGAPLLVYPIVIFSQKLRRMSHRSQQEMANLSSVLHEAITGIRIVKAFSMESFEMERFKKAVRKLFRINLRVVKVISISPPIMEILGGLAAALIIFYGRWQIGRGAMTAGQYASLIGAMFLMYMPIKRLSRISGALQQALAAVDRIYEILDIEEDVEEKADAAELAQVKGKVEFENVSFRYGEEDILKNVSLKVEPGEILAIVGPSGAGKSTLVNLIPRFFDPGAGRITVDGIDIRDVALSSLRRQIAFVTQEVILFNDAVENNIAYGRREVPREAIQRAARIAYAHDFICNLPQGYKTVVGEKGIKLSGGERQRIAIARAALKNAPILILDEATSALDTESERIVQDALLNIMRDRTVFIIAHRLSTIRLADRIAVVADGAIRELGSHEDLLKKNGVYARLYGYQKPDWVEMSADWVTGEEKG
jgi:subfamily B ATP-binding cassette protein MsbA